jgi:ribosomal protein S18 acetylase RimI-like enzyme
MNLILQSVAEHGLEAAAALATRSFSGYFVPINITLTGLLAMVRQDSVDPALSRVLIVDGQPAGIAFIARRGWTSRLAAMAIVPEARTRGVGREAMRLLLAEAKVRGDRAMTLEVIAQNAPAIRLYESCGFRIDRRLVGYSGKPENVTSELALAEADVRDAARALVAHGPPDLPWQLSGETLAQIGPPAVAHRAGNAWVVLSDPASPTIVIRAVITVPHARQRELASDLLRAVVARHPDREWRAPAIWPEEMGGLFEQIGLRRSDLTQWQMTSRF